MNYRYQAQKYMMNVIQFYEGKYDNIQPMYFGEYIKDLPATVYYELVEFETYFIIVYCFSHRKDWSNSEFILYKELDSHELDFEGVVKCVDRKSREVLWTCTRFHYDLKFVDHDIDYINIESQGHGIKPGYPKKKKEDFIEYSKDSFSFRDMGTDRFKNYVYKIFEKHPVTPWMTWNDWRIERKFGKETNGLILSDPQQIFELAKECLIVRSLK